MIDTKEKIDEFIDENWKALFDLSNDIVYIASIPVNKEDVNGDYTIQFGVKKDDSFFKLSFNQIKPSSSKSLKGLGFFNEKYGDDAIISFNNRKEVNEFKLQIKTITENKIRPLSGGCAISYKNGKSQGTLGAIVKLKCEPENTYLLSNHHVLCKNKFSPNRVIYQPSLNHRSRIDYTNAIALVKYGRFDDYADAALAVILEKVDYKGGVIWNNSPILDTDKPRINGEVSLHGKNTHYSKGIIHSDNLYIKLKNPSNNQYKFFKKHLLLSKMSQEGDSGSIILQDQNMVGLHIGGDGKHFSVASNVKYVFGPDAEYLNGNNQKQTIELQEFVKP